MVYLFSTNLIWMNQNRSHIEYPFRRISEMVLLKLWANPSEQFESHLIVIVVNRACNHLFDFCVFLVTNDSHNQSEMDSASISTALQNMDVGTGNTGGNMEDAMQNFIKNHVLSNPITCESTKTKWVISVCRLAMFDFFFCLQFFALFARSFLFLPFEQFSTRSDSPKLILLMIYLWWWWSLTDKLFKPHFWPKKQKKNRHPNRIAKRKFI